MSTLEETVSIAVDADGIEGTFVTPGTLIPGVLFVHGWGGSQAQYLARAREIAALGCVCLTFDLRGHAQDIRQFETVTRAQNLRDVLAAYDRLARRPHVDPEAIAVVGSSYGGYLAAILTALRAVKWLALRAPALYVDAHWDSPKLQLHKDYDLRAYRHRLLPAADNKALRACSEFDGDVLLVESEDDAFIPKEVIKSYREATRHARSTTYRFLNGADHGLTTAEGQRSYSDVLVAWMKEMIVGARRGVVVPPVSEKVETPEAPPHPATV